MEVTPVVVVPPVTVKLIVLLPGLVNAKVAVRELKGPAGLVEPDGTHANVAAVSGSVAVSVSDRPASASQLPLNWFTVAPTIVYAALGAGGPPRTMLTLAVAVEVADPLVTRTVTG